MKLDELLQKIRLSSEISSMLESAKKVILPRNRRELIDYIFDHDDNKNFAEIRFDIPHKGSYLEGTIARCKNGLAVNFEDISMRRRDPEAMVIADNLPTDKTTYKDRFNTEFSTTRKETLDWLQEQELVVIPFYAGDMSYNYLSLAFVPVQATFFALSLGDLQGLVNFEDIKKDEEPCCLLFMAPTFRHTHFEGRQVVVHDRSNDKHEIFAYNLYPGPSAKKGVYGTLLNVGEKEQPAWSTLHCSTVRVVTPYECELVIMHEGASGGGKTEMTQDSHLRNGRLRLARNVDTDESFIFDMNDTCDLYPITDDMGLIHPSQQNGKKLQVEDAEDSWFLRVDHLNRYGIDYKLEALCIAPPEPLVFLNIDGKPGATALLWDHIMDDIEKPCPNPRIILPRKYIPNIANGPVPVDIRSFGVRSPRCTKETPSYGILGIMQILPPALAWIWRLVAPRGHANPSIIASGKGLKSEGVGSYWPFALGKKVDQANILLRQIQETPETGYLLIPNQFVGAYQVGFNGQWLTREYVARRGGLRFRQGQLTRSRCALLGYSPSMIKFNSVPIPRGLLRVEEQQEVGTEAYDIGAKELMDFFKKELEFFRSEAQLSPLGKAIIDVCLSDGTVDDYVSAMPFNSSVLGL